MMDILGISTQALVAQLLVGLINGSFYALLSLGLAIILGLLHIVNFTHGAQFMLGAFFAWLGLTSFGGWIGMPGVSLGYFAALLAVPVILGALAMGFERTMLRRLYGLDPVYGLLLTFGLALVIEGLFRHWFGVSGRAYPVPDIFKGVFRLEALGISLPIYRIWAVVVSLSLCVVVWAAIELTKFGALLRAGTENPKLLQAFGVNVPLLVCVAYGIGVALAGFAGVVAAPIYQASPFMGSSLIIIVFAVVVIGGAGSIIGTIVTGVGLGLIEGLTKVFYPEASTVVIFVIMALVLLVKPAGLFGKEV